MAEESTNGQANFTEVLEVSVNPQTFEDGLSRLEEAYNAWVSRLGENAPAVTGFGTGAVAGLKDVQEQFKTFASQAVATFGVLESALGSLAALSQQTQTIIDERVQGSITKQAEGQKQRVSDNVQANQDILASDKELANKQDALASRKRVPTPESDTKLANEYGGVPKPELPNSPDTRDVVERGRAIHGLGPDLQPNVQYLSKGERTRDEINLANQGQVDATYSKQLERENTLNAVEAKRDAARKRALEEWIQLLGKAEAESERLAVTESKFQRPSFNPPVLPPIDEKTVLTKEQSEERDRQQQAVLSDNVRADEVRTARIAAEDKVADIKQQINKLESEHTAALSKSAGVLQDILSLEDRLALVRVRGDLDAKSGVLRGQLASKQRELAALEPSRHVDTTGLSTEEVTKLTAKQQQYEAVLGDITKLTNDLSAVDERRFALVNKRTDERIAAETRQLALTEQLAAADDKVALAEARRGDLQAQRAIHQGTLDRIQAKQAELPPVTLPVASPSTTENTTQSLAEAEEARLSGVIESINAKLNAAEAEQVTTFRELERLQAELLESSKLGQAERVDQVHEANQEILSDYERLNREITAKTQEIQGVRERLSAARSQDNVQKPAIAEEVQQAVRPTPAEISVAPPAATVLPEQTPPPVEVGPPVKEQPVGSIRVEPPPVAHFEEPLPTVKVEPPPVAHVEPVPSIRVEQPSPAKVEPVQPIKVEQPPVVKVETPAPLQVEPTPPLKVDIPPPLKVEPVPALKAEPQPRVETPTQSSTPLPPPDKKALLEQLDEYYTKQIENAGKLSAEDTELAEKNGELLRLLQAQQALDVQHNVQLDDTITKLLRIVELKQRAAETGREHSDLLGQREVATGDLRTAASRKTEPPLEPKQQADTADLKAQNDLLETRKGLRTQEAAAKRDIQADNEKLDAQEKRITSEIEKRKDLEFKGQLAALDGRPAEQAALWDAKLKEVEADLEKINQLRAASPTGRLSLDEETNANKLQGRADTFKAGREASLKDVTTLQDRYTAAVTKTTDAQQRLASTSLVGNTAAQLDQVIKQLAIARAEMQRLQATGSLNIASGGTITPTDVQNQEAYAVATEKVRKGIVEQISLTRQLGEEHQGVFSSIVESFTGAISVALKYSLAYGAVFEALRGLKTVAMAPFEGIKEGIGYLKDLEDKSYDLGAVFAANAKFSSDFGTNMKLSHQAGVEAMKELQDKAIALRIPLETAVGSLRALLEGKGLDLTRTPKELVDVAADLQVIAKTRPKDSKFSAQQLQGDLPKLFSEDVEQGNAYLQILQLTVGQWQAMLEHAGRFKDLQEQLNAIPVFKPLLEAAKQSQGNLSVLEQTFELLRKRIEAVGASEAFDNLKVGLEGVNKWIEAHGTEIEAVLKGIVSLIVNVVTSLVRMSNATGISSQLAGFLKGLALDFTVLATAAATTFDSIATGAEIAAASATLHLSKIPGLISDFKQRQNEREDTERAVAAQVIGVSSPTPAVSPQTQGALDKYKAELTQQEEVYNKAEARNKSWAAEATKRITDLGKHGVLTQEEVTKQIGDINKKQAEGVAAFAKQQADAAAVSMAEFQRTTKQVGTGVINTPTAAAGTVVPLKGNVTELEAELSKAEADYKSGLDAAKNKAADARQDIEDLAKTTPDAYKKAAAEIAGINAEELRKLDELARAVLTKAAEVREKLAAKGKDQTISDKEQEKALAAFDTKLENLNTSIENTKSQTARSGKRDVRTAEQEEVRSETSNLGEDKDRVLADAEYVKQKKISDARELFAAGKSTEEALHKATIDALAEEKSLVDQVISAYKKGINDIKGIEPTTRGKLLNTADIAGTRKDESIDRETTSYNIAKDHERFASEKALAEGELAFLKQESSLRIQLAKDSGASETQIADLTAEARQQAFAKEQSILQAEISTFSEMNDTKKRLLQRFDQAETLNGWQLQADAVKRASASIRDSLRDLENSYKDAAESQKLVLRSAEDSTSTTLRTREVILRLAQSYLDLGKAQQFRLQQLLNTAYDNNDYETIQKVTSALDRQKQAVIQLTEQRDHARKRDTTGYDPIHAQLIQQSEEKINDNQRVKELQEQIQRVKDERSHLLASVDLNKPVIDASNANTVALRDLTSVIRGFSLPQPPPLLEETAGKSQPTEEVKSSSEPQAAQEVAVPQPAAVQAPIVRVEVPTALPAAFRDIVAKVSQLTGVSSDLITAVMRKESSFKPALTSPKGAQGLMQLMPGTAKEQGVTNSFDPAQNVLGGSKYLAGLLEKFGGDLLKALAAYNAGPARVESGKSLPAETKNYLEKILVALVSSKVGSPSSSASPTPSKPGQSLPTTPTQSASPHGGSSILYSIFRDHGFATAPSSSATSPPLATSPVVTAELTALQKLTAALQADSVSKLSASLKTTPSEPLGEVASFGKSPVTSSVVSPSPVTTAVLTAIQKLTDALQADSASKLSASLKANASGASTFPEVNPTLTKVEESPDFQNWARDHFNSAIDTNVPSIVAGQGEQSPEIQARFDALTDALKVLTQELKDTKEVQASKQDSTKKSVFGDVLNVITGGGVQDYEAAKEAKKSEPEGASTSQDTAREGAAVLTSIKNIVGAIQAEKSIFKQGAETGGTMGGVGAILANGPLSDALSKIPLVGVFVKPVGQLISMVADAFTAGSRKIAAEIQAQFDATTKQISEGILGTGAGLNALMAERDAATNRLFARRDQGHSLEGITQTFGLSLIFGNGAMEALAKLLPPMTEKIEELVRLQAQIFTQFENQLHSMQLQSDTLGQINSQWQSINQEVAKYIDAGGSATEATKMLQLGIRQIEREAASELSQGYDAAVKDAIQLYDLTKQRTDMEKSFKQQEFGLVNADSEERTQAGAVSRGQQLEQLREDFQKNLDNINSEISLDSKKVAAESKLFDIAKNISDLHRQDEALQLASLQIQLQKYRDLMAVTSQISGGKVLPGKGDPKLVAQLEGLDQQISGISAALEADIATNHQGRSGKDTAALQALLAQQKVVEAALTKSAGGSLVSTGAAGGNLQAVESALGALTDQASFASAHPDTDTGGWGDAAKLLAYLNMLKDLTSGLSQQQSNLLNSSTLIGTGSAKPGSGQDLTFATLQQLLNAGLSGTQKVTSLTPPSAPSSTDAGTASFSDSGQLTLGPATPSVTTSAGQISSLGTQAASASTQLTNLATAVSSVTSKLTGTVQPVAAKTPSVTQTAKHVTTVSAVLPTTTTPTPVAPPLTGVQQLTQLLESKLKSFNGTFTAPKSPQTDWLMQGLKNTANAGSSLPLDGFAKRLESYTVTLAARPLANNNTFHIVVNGSGLDPKAVGQQVAYSVASEIQRQSRQAPR